MTSTDSQIRKPPIANAANRLTPDEIEALREDKRRTSLEVRAWIAARKAKTENKK